MSHMQSVNIALAFLTAANNAEQSAKDEIARLTAENAKLAAEQSKKPAKAKSAKGAVAAPPIHGRSTVCGIALPDKGSLTAEAYLRAMLDAGKRPVHMVKEVSPEGKTSCHVVPQPTETSYVVLRILESEIRNDQIKAIAGFCGYDNREMFGTQETAARMLAQRLTSGHPVVGLSRSEERQADRSAQGFIAGCPTPVATRVADLQARMVVAAEMLCQHQKDALDSVRGEYQVELSRGLALVEEERISSIRDDIARLTF